MTAKTRKTFWMTAILLLLALMTLSASSTSTTVITIDQAIITALERHTEILQSEIAVELAELELGAALTEAWIPSINLTVSPPLLTLEGFTGDLTGAFTAGLSLPLGTSSKMSAGFDIAWDSEISDWEVRDWGITYSQGIDFTRITAASRELEDKKDAVETARDALNKTRNKTVLETLKSYLSLLATSADYEQKKSDLSRAEAEFVQIQSLVEAELASETALQEARLEVLDAQIALDERETEYTVEKETFGREVLGEERAEDFALAPLELPLEALKRAVEDLLEQEALLDRAVQNASEVEEARGKVADTQETLLDERRTYLPTFSLQAGINEQGWEFGLTISLNLFIPNYRLNIQIAQMNLSLAEERLEATEQRVKEDLLNQAAALRSALNNVKRLPLEQEKWVLEEDVMQAKFEAGAISEEDWKMFSENKAAFEQSMGDRINSLLFTLLSYRNELGLELNWEDWLR